MDGIDRGAGMVASLGGAVGVFLIGFFGSEVLFTPGVAGVAVEVTLVPSIAAAVAAFVYLLTEPAEDRDLG